ncbi:hypothetical protein BK025_16380 [Sodalis sp. TME1]|nr:hypothetical protein BK025_16380 [Sodalis sp. TME1]
MLSSFSPRRYFIYLHQLYIFNDQQLIIIICPRLYFQKKKAGETPASSRFLNMLCGRYRG